MSFVESVSSLGNAFTNLAGGISNVSGSINQIELPEVKTTHNFGLDNKTLGILVATILAVALFFGFKKRRR